MFAPRGLVLACVVASVPVTAAADQVPLSTPQLAAPGGLVAPPRTSPYQDLFQPSPPKPPDVSGQVPRDNEEQRRRAQEALRGQLQLRTSQQPQVVCGMTILPADPSIDPKIFLQNRFPDVPRADVDHHIRRIPPPVCRP